MKKLIFVVTAIATLSLVAPFASIAEPVYPNQIGLYTTMDSSGDTGTDVIGASVDLYLMLVNPEVNGETCSILRATDCQMNFNPPGNLSLTYFQPNGPGDFFGDTDHVSDGWLEFILYFRDGAAIFDDHIILAHIRLINENAGPVEVTLGPFSHTTDAPSSVFPGIEGQMSFWSYPPGQPPEIMYPVSGSPEAPVFIFNGEALPVDHESFGSVKALYR